MTLILVPALMIVGANVTAAIGSKNAASGGLTARSASTSGSPSAASSASGASVMSCSGRRLASASSSGASLGSALSATLGIEAWPARPRVVSEKRKTPFSAVHTP